MAYPNNLPGPGDFISPWERDAAPAERPYDKYDDDRRASFSDRAEAMVARAIAEGWGGEMFALAVIHGEAYARGYIAAKNNTQQGEVK